MFDSKNWVFDTILKFLLVYILGVPIVLVVTPVRWVFDFCTIYHPDIFRRRNDHARHKAKVELVQRQVKAWNGAGRPNLMCTARPTWQTLSIRHLNKSKFTQIRVDLEDILEIDTDNKVLTVEPGMKMGTLTHRLLKLGWTIPVIPELESLTVGGCINGTGIETSSHKFGLFADACLEYELVMGDGSVVTCSKIVNSDLFYSISWSHGTIGFLTAVKIPLIKAPKYVKVHYFPTDSLNLAEALLRAADPDFVEGIMFGLGKIVVMHGKMTEDAETDKINLINRWYKPWFYTHVESKLAKKESSVEYLLVRDYYHRHQRSYFWEVGIPCPIGNHFLIRYLFGWIYPLNFQLMKLLSTEYLWDLVYTPRHVLQDFLVPMSSLAQTLEISHREVEVYPIWICPCKFFKLPTFAHLPVSCKDDLFVDVGIYGVSPKSDFNTEKKIRKLEKFVAETKGFQFLYADTFMTRAEFRTMFDVKHYDNIRKKYRCDTAFPEVYDKISRHARK